MSNLDYLNLSTDLRRIALWLQTGNETLAEKFIQISLGKFGNDKEEICGRMVGNWLRRVAAHKSRGWKSAEDALTLSVVLKNRFGM